MAQKPAGPPHAGHRLSVAIADMHAAAAAVAAGQAAAVAAHVAELELGRQTKTQRRAERLAAIEARNKSAAGHPDHHPG